MIHTEIHLHTDFSNGTTSIDSVTKYTEYIDRAKELGMKAIAFTEHGNVYNWLSKMNACSKAGIKYIHGVEIYITESLEDMKRDNYHTILLARNQAGLEEINILVSNSNNREDGHFYYTPRITLDEFEKITENVIVSSACLGGIIGKGTNTARNRYLKYFMNHKDTCFLELQHHNFEGQKQLNRNLLKIAEKTGLRLVIGTDTHSLNEKKAKGRSILQLAKKISFPEEEECDLTMKTTKDLFLSYVEQGVVPKEIVLEALENTNVIADMIGEYTVDKTHKYPSMAENPEEELLRQISEGIKTRGVDNYLNYDVYCKRIEEEVAVYKHNGAFNFMLLMSDVMRFCRSKDIKLGYGRGSVTGSIVAYLLGITELDSIKQNLNFARFMNSERISLPDIDSDIPPSRRQEIREYLFSKQGLYCYDIMTFNTVALKGALKEVGRAFGMKQSVMGEISRTLEFKEDKLRIQYPELFEYADIINGAIISVGIHPAGVITSPFPLEGVVGTYTSKVTPYPISQLNMKEIDSMNFVKLDLLGLDAVEIIQKVCEYTDIDFITPDNIDDEDEAVWKDLSESTQFIFQFESESGQAYCKHLLSEDTISKIRENHPSLKKIDLLSIGNGAIRPAGASYRDALARGEFRDNGHEALNKFLAKTNGYLVYQEQVMEFLHEFCGFTMGESDEVRRAFSKKYGTEQYTPRIKAGFVKAMKEKYNVPEREANELIVNFIQVIEDASAYLFNLNHAQAYSYMGYAEAYLKHYYPIEFMTAFLHVKQGKEGDTVAMSTYAKAHGVEISIPKFGFAKGEYMFSKEKSTIYKGVASVKSLNASLGDGLFALAKTKEYKHFLNLLVDITEQGMGSKGLITLAGLGFFDKYAKNKKIMGFIEIFQDGKGVKYDKKYAEKNKLKRLEELAKIWDEMPDEDLNIIAQVSHEMEFLGYGNTVYPEMEEDIYIISKSEEKSWCTIINCYNIQSGINAKMYMSPRDLVGINKMKDTGVIRITKTREDKSGKVWIDSYSLIQ